MSNLEKDVLKEGKSISDLHCADHGNKNIEFDGSNVNLGS